MLSFRWDNACNIRLCIDPPHPRRHRTLLLHPLVGGLMFLIWPIMNIDSFQSLKDRKKADRLEKWQLEQEARARKEDL